jgi:ABC-type uncharacterized transport system auxiliary subunit
VIRRGFPLAAALLVGACATTVPPVDRYYRIDTASAGAATAAPAQSILLEPFEAHGIYAERALLVRDAGTGGASLRQYGHQFWIEPPALMLDGVLAATLRGAFGETHVHARASRERPDFQVRPRLRRLEQVTGVDGAKAAYAVEFAVSDRDGRPRFVLSFDETEPAATTGPDTYVTALDALVARANARLVERLAAEFGRGAAAR